MTGYQPYSGKIDTEVAALWMICKQKGIPVPSYIKNDPLDTHAAAAYDEMKKKEDIDKDLDFDLSLDDQIR